MTPNLSIGQMYQSLYGAIKERRRLQLFGILILISITMLLEFASVLLIAPLMDSILGAPNSMVIAELGFFSDQAHVNVLWFGLLIGAGTAAKILTQYLSSLWSHMVAHDFGEEALGRYLDQKYEKKIAANKSEYLAVLGSKLNVLAVSFLTPTLQMIASVAPLLGIFSAFIIIAPLLTILGVVVLGVLYGVITISVRATLGGNSVRISEGSNTVMHALRSILDRPRAVSLDLDKTKNLARFSVADRCLKRALAKNILISHIPRFVVEGGVLVVMVTVAFFTLDLNRLVDNFGELSVFALGLQRGLPMLQRLYVGYTAMKGNLHSLSHVISVLNVPSEYKVHPRSRELQIKALKTRDLEIKLPGWKASRFVPDMTLIAGATYVFFAHSGYGKTVLAEHLVGLRQCFSGSVLVDHQPVHYGEMFDHIAFMANDETIEDSSLVEFFHDVPCEPDEIKSLLIELGLGDLFVNRDFQSIQLGTSNMLLSLGQLQRIRLAKALLSKKQITVLDEPTANLDSELSEKVISVIMKYKRYTSILIIISHHEIWPSSDFNIVRLDSK